ncbi:MAG: DNA-binding protein [Eubacterium sp.]|nr:DNA-binding protein [Eubacterium sp.]
MEDIVRRTLLYDFYGELLTEHQKDVYADAVLNDLSYSEIASEYGISRQGVYDLVKRCDAILEGYEAKLLLIDRFESVKEKQKDILNICNDLISELNKTESDEALNNSINRIIEITEDIIEEL